MIALYILLILGYAILSFAKTDPNLVYSYHSSFMSFQKFMWNLGYENRLLFSILYALVISLLFIAYLSVIKQVKRNKISFKKALYLTFVSSIILIFANPALSHDIFNYIFNAKMVSVYGANPHIKTALEFSSDPWVQFMHNTHTPAPYGYGWTGLSMIPYALGFGKIKTTLLSFKVFIGAFFFLLLYFQKKMQSLLKLNDSPHSIFLFALNPLVLIETFGNGHNDVVMMGLLFSGVFFIWKYFKSKKIIPIILGLLLIALSVSIKIASIMIIPGLMLIWLSDKFQKKIRFGESSVLTHSFPLLTGRSQRFLPWYAIWPFSFIPFTKNKLLITTLIAFTFSSLMRHIPVLFLPIHDRPISDEIIRMIEMIITFSIPLFAIMIYKLKNLKKR